MVRSIISLLLSIDSLFNFAKKARSSLKIVIESNLHVYAFVPNSKVNLHVKILNLFVELRVFLVLKVLLLGNSS